MRETLLSVVLFVLAALLRHPVSSALKNPANSNRFAGNNMSLSYWMNLGCCGRLLVMANR